MELKPCPFCGGDNVVFTPDPNEDQQIEDTTTGFIWCHGCGFSSDSYFSEEIAAEHWNRRAASENKPLTCEGCEHEGKYEAEYEYGYPSPCTFCKRRAADNYTRKPERDE